MANIQHRYTIGIYCGESDFVIDSDKVILANNGGTSSLSDVVDAIFSPHYSTNSDGVTTIDGDSYSSWSKKGSNSIEGVKHGQEFTHLNSITTLKPGTPYIILKNVGGSDFEIPGFTFDNDNINPTETPSLTFDKTFTVALYTGDVALDLDSWKYSYLFKSIIGTSHSVGRVGDNGLVSFTSNHTDNTLTQLKKGTAYLFIKNNISDSPTIPDLALTCANLGLPEENLIDYQWRVQVDTIGFIPGNIDPFNVSLSNNDIPYQGEANNTSINFDVTGLIDDILKGNNLGNITLGLDDNLAPYITGGEDGIQVTVTVKGENVPIDDNDIDLTDTILGIQDIQQQDQDPDIIITITSTLDQDIILVPVDDNIIQPIDGVVELDDNVGVNNIVTLDESNNGDIIRSNNTTIATVVSVTEGPTSDIITLNDVNGVNYVLTLNESVEIPASNPEYKVSYIAKGSVVLSIQRISTPTPTPTSTVTPTPTPTNTVTPTVTPTSTVTPTPTPTVTPTSTSYSYIDDYDY